MIRKKTIADGESVVTQREFREGITAVNENILAIHETLTQLATIVAKHGRQRTTLIDLTGNPVSADAIRATLKAAGRDESTDPRPATVTLEEAITRVRTDLDSINRTLGEVERATSSSSGR